MSVRSHGTLGSRDRESLKNLIWSRTPESGSVNIGLTILYSTHTRPPPSIAITHTLSMAQPASHSRASAAYYYIFRQYYLRVTASVSQVHVRYIKTYYKKKKSTTLG